MAITNGTGTVIINGLSAGKEFRCVSGSELKPATAFVADGEGGLLGTMAIGVTDDDIATYAIDKMPLAAQTTYDITGSCVPAGATVYLSEGYTGSIESLKNGISRQVQSDSEGYFEFSGVVGAGAVVVLWVRAEVTGGLSEASNIGLSATATVTSVDTDIHIEAKPYVDANTGKTLLLATYFGAVTGVPCSSCDGSAESCHCTDGVSPYVRYTFTGAYPDGVEAVRLSTRECKYCGGKGCSNCNETGIAVDLDNPTAEALLEAVHSANIMGENGSGFYNLSSMYNQTNESGKTFIVWAEAEEGPLTIEGFTVTDGYTGSCLSGDTLITLADGSAKRLDCLEETDILQGENGPVRVKHLARGLYGKRHTLYHFDNGVVVDETGPHRFYNVTQGFWQHLSRWKIGDCAVDENGQKVALTATEQVVEPCERFGVWTEDGSYYANGLLSGATSCNRRLMADATMEQMVDMMVSMEERQLLEMLGLEDELL